MTPQQKQSIRERLASIEHERWADWQKWCHKILREQVSKIGLEEVLKRWDKQIGTPYSELSEKEKQSDRDQVDRYWPLIETLLEEELARQREEMVRKICERQKDWLGQEEDGSDRDPRYDELEEVKALLLANPK